MASYMLSSASQSLHPSNAGGASLDISSITTSPNFPKGTTCGTSLAEGASCQFLVNFLPSALAAFWHGCAAPQALLP
jgi:hypothetical protein